MQNNGLSGPRIWIEQFNLESLDGADIIRVAQPSTLTDVAAGATLSADLILNGECWKNNVAFTMTPLLEASTDTSATNVSWSTIFEFPTFGGNEYDGAYNDFTRVTMDIPALGDKGSVRLVQEDIGAAVLTKDDQIWAFIRMEVFCNKIPIASGASRLTTFSDDFSVPANAWDLSASGITGTCSGAGPQMCFDAQGIVAPNGNINEANGAIITSLSSFDFSDYYPFVEFTIQSEFDATPNTDWASEGSRLYFEYSLVNPANATRFDWIPIRAFSGHKTTSAAYGTPTKIQLFIPDAARKANVWIRFRHRDPRLLNPFIETMREGRHASADFFYAGSPTEYPNAAFDGRWIISNMSIHKFAPWAGQDGTGLQMQDDIKLVIRNVDYNTSDTTPVTGEFTVTTWVNLQANSSTLLERVPFNTSSPDWKIGFASLTSNQSTIDVGTPGSYPYVTLDIGGNVTTVYSNVSVLGDWHFLAVTWNTNDLNIYVDGALATASTDDSAAVGPIPADVGDISGGNYNSTGTFVGSIDTLAFFSNSFFIDRVQTYYYTNPLTTVSDLLGLYTFDEVSTCSGVTDSSSIDFNHGGRHDGFITHQYARVLRNQNRPYQFTSSTPEAVVTLFGSDILNSPADQYTFELKSLPESGSLFSTENGATKADPITSTGILTKGIPHLLIFECHEFDTDGSVCTGSLTYSVSLNGIPAPNDNTVLISVTPPAPSKNTKGKIIVDDSLLYYGVGGTAVVLVGALVAYNFVQYRRRLAADKFRSMFYNPELTLEYAFTIPFFLNNDCEKWIKTNEESMWYLEELVLSNTGFLDSLTDLFVTSSANDVIRAIIYLAEGSGQATSFMKHFIDKHIDDISTAPTLFRGSNLASKMWSAYTGLTFGLSYKNATLARPLYDLLTENVDKRIELNADRTDDSVQINKYRLMASTQTVFESILDNADMCPLQMRAILSHVKNAVEKKFPGSGVISVGGFIFLRFFCPGVAVPEQNGLLREEPDENSRNTLILVARVLQNLANFVEFGVKETHMQTMNDFIVSNRTTMEEYLHEIAEVDEEDLEVLEAVELPQGLKELSILLLYEFMVKNKEDLMKRIEVRITDSEKRTQTITNINQLYDALGEPVKIPIFVDEDNLDIV